jgi:calnexin
MQNDILFDNIYIGHSIEDAEKLKKETFDLKIAAEKAEEEANAPKSTDSGTPDGLSFKDDPITYSKEKLTLFLNLAKQNPIDALKSVPEVTAAIGVLLLTIVAIVVSQISATENIAVAKEKTKEAAKKAKEVAADAKDKAAEAVATGAEKAQAEVNKRTTRSSAS